MENKQDTLSKEPLRNAQIAELSDACMEKIQQFERELNKQGFWNIALVAYQLKN
mgnify:CR=1 FL=1